MASKRDKLKNGFTSIDMTRQMTSSNDTPPDGSIVRREDGTFELAGLGYTLTPVGFQPDSNGQILTGIDSSQWETIGETLFNLEGSIQWLIGDWLAAGERAGYGDAKQIAEYIGREPVTLYKWARTSREIEFDNRLSNLSHTHHATVVYECADPAHYRVWLERANEESMSVTQLKQTIRQAQQDNKTQDTATQINPVVIANSDAASLNRRLQTLADASDRLKYLQEYKAVIERLIEDTERERRRGDVQPYAATSSNNAQEDQADTQPVQLQDTQLKMLLRLYQKGPISDAYHTNHMTIARELEALGFAKIEQHGTRYTAYIVRHGEQHLRDIGEIVG